MAPFALPPVVKVSHGVLGAVQTVSEMGKYPFISEKNIYMKHCYWSTDECTKSGLC